MYRVRNLYGEMSKKVHNRALSRVEERMKKEGHQVRLGSTNIVVNKNGFGALPIQRVSDEEAVF